MQLCCWTTQYTYVRIINIIIIMIKNELKNEHNRSENSLRPNNNNIILNEDGHRQGRLDMGKNNVFFEIVKIKEKCTFVRFPWRQLLSRSCEKPRPMIREFEYLIIVVVVSTLSVDQWNTQIQNGPSFRTYLLA